MKSIIIFSLSVLMFSCSNSKSIDWKETMDFKVENKAIEQVMSLQEKAWSAGDIDQFMEGYWKSEKLKFTGSKGTTYGWKETQANYKKGYPDKSAMGKLSFVIKELEFISAEAAVMIGQYTLVRESDTPTGFFTLVWKKIDGKWLITSDMTCG